MVLLNRVMQPRAAFDIIHFHTDYLHFPLAGALTGKTLTTLHGRLDMPDLAAVYREFPKMPLVSISDAQRVHLSWANWAATVYHGLPPDLYASAKARRLSRLPRPDLPGEAAGPGDRDRAQGRRCR